MTSKRKFKSEAFAAIRGAAQGLHRAGVRDKATMRKFDTSCLVAPRAVINRPSDETDQLSSSCRGSLLALARNARR
jgi:hypothetical protein